MATVPTYVHRAISAPADDVATVRSWFTYLRDASAPNLPRELSVNGQKPATAYLGFGKVGSVFATYVDKPVEASAPLMRDAMLARKAQPQFPGMPPDTFVVPTLAEIEDVMSRVYVSNKEDVNDVLADLGLQFVQSGGLG